ncbi:MAG TPA: hypothetical protein VH854_08455, partial [Thermoanaerobaculia bacterium]|nr:hypothetical protein [Thermoanaerobaculia bacterium]
MTRTHSLAVALLVILPPSVAPAADSRPIEEFQAVSVSLDTARSWPVVIAVERWTPDSEREAL